jgi:erythromycin esterase-like protein
MKAVLQYLEQVDPDAARRARARYACFDHFGPDPQIYGFIAASDLDRSCKDQVVSQLVELRRRATETARRDGRIAEEEFFYAEQNALVVKNAEEYYRSMFFGEVSSWNLRDGHMVETLETLVAHLGRQGRRAKVIVWAHNSHLGDARATAMGRRGSECRPAGARKIWPRCGADRLHHRPRTSQPPPTGTTSLSASTYDRRLPAAGRPCSTRAHPPAFCSTVVAIGR